MPGLPTTGERPPSRSRGPSSQCLLGSRRSDLDLSGEDDRKIEGEGGSAAVIGCVNPLAPPKTANNIMIQGVLLSGRRRLSISTSSEKMKLATSPTIVVGIATKQLARRSVLLASARGQIRNL